MEVPRKLRGGWHARQEVSPRAMHGRKVWPRWLCGCPENYINQGRILTQAERRRKAKSFHRKMHRHPCLCAFQPYPTPHTYISGDKEKKANYIFIHQRFCCSLYSTLIIIGIIIILFNNLHLLTHGCFFSLFNSISTFVDYLMPKPSL